MTLRVRLKRGEITKRRKALGRSIADLARGIGHSESATSRIESGGTASIDAITLKWLADELKCSQEDLVAMKTCSCGASTGGEAEICMACAEAKRSELRVGECLMLARQWKRLDRTDVAIAVGLCDRSLALIELGRGDLSKKTVTLRDLERAYRLPDGFLSACKDAPVDVPARSAMASQVRQKRKAKGLSREALARQASVSKSTIAEIEDNGRTPYPDTLERIERVLGRLAGG